MIKIEFILPGTTGIIACNDTVYQLNSYAVSGRRFSETEADTIVVYTGGIGYTTEDGSLVVVGGNSVKTTITTAGTLPAVAEPVAEPVVEPVAPTNIQEMPARP